MTTENNSATQGPAYPPKYDCSDEKWWRRIRPTDFGLVFVILAMLLWPWILFSMVHSRKGIHLGTDLSFIALLVIPQQINFFITFLGTMVRMIVAFLFSNAILRFWQERMSKKSLNLFHLSLISGLKNQKVPWGPGELWHLFHSQWWLRVVLVAGCWATFILVPSSITSLLTPVPFNKYTTLHGNELDLSSTASDCLDWLGRNSLLYNNNSCGWMTYNGSSFTTCLVQNQLEDVLESGRANVFSVLNQGNEESLFTQINTEFFGPVRGVLPIGPAGVPAFNTVSEVFPFPNLTGVLSYNYTLDNQGIQSTVNCSSASQSPVVISAIPGDTSNVVLQYSGTCDGPGEADILDASQPFVVFNSSNSLMFWACKSALGEAGDSLSYTIYLRGTGSVYEQAVGNITCNISQIQSTIIPVLFQWNQRYFVAPDDPDLDPLTTAIFSNITDQLVISLGGLVKEGQSQASNLLAESVITLGVKYGNSSDPMYPQLYQAMIQGVVEYLFTYSRVVYNLYSGTKETAPPSCVRQLTGILSYQVIGWSVQTEHIAFLMPFTIVNLASLVLMFFAIKWTVSGSYKSDPVHAESLALARLHCAQNGHKWEDYVTYHDRGELE